MSVNVPLGPLLDPAFHLGTVPTTWAELLGFATGGVNVWLVVRQNILNWPIGIANVILLGLVFLDGGLYADSGLQVFYIALQLYGWWVWLTAGTAATTCRSGARGATSGPASSWRVRPVPRS